MTEEKQSELDEVVENVLMIVGTLGYRVFIPMTTNVDQQTRNDAEQYLYLKRKMKKSNQIIEAKCERTTEGFVVLEGSQVEMIDSPAIPTSLKELRKELIKENVIKDGILQEKQLFSSPSYAAAFVLGMNTNGRMDWKDKDGKTLKELEEMIYY